MGGRVAEQLERTRVPVRFTGDQVAVPDRYSGAVDNELQAQLALAQRPLSLALLRAVPNMRVEAQHEDAARGADSSRDRMHGNRQPVTRGRRQQSQAHARQLATPCPVTVRAHEVILRMSQYV